MKAFKKNKVKNRKKALKVKNNKITKKYLT